MKIMLHCLFHIVNPNILWRHYVISFVETKIYTKLIKDSNTDSHLFKLYDSTLFQNVKTNQQKPSFVSDYQLLLLLLPNQHI